MFIFWHSEYKNIIKEMHNQAKDLKQKNIRRGYRKRWNKKVPKES